MHNIFSLKSNSSKKHREERRQLLLNASCLLLLCCLVVFSEKRVNAQIFPSSAPTSSQGPGQKGCKSTLLYVRNNTNDVLYVGIATRATPNHAPVRLCCFDGWYRLKPGQTVPMKHRIPILDFYVAVGDRNGYWYDPGKSIEGPDPRDYRSGRLVPYKKYVLPRCFGKGYVLELNAPSGGIL